MDSILKIINCVNCESTLISPVLLPCGHSVCKKHAIESSEPTIRCRKCGQDHSIPTNSFPHNEALSMLIETEIGKLDFGETYNKAKRCCSELGDIHEKIDALLKDPNMFTYEHVNDLRNKIQVKSEEMKLRIDKEVDRLMEKLSEFESDTKDFSKSKQFTDKAKNLEMNLKESLSNLRKSHEFLNKMRIDEREWKNIIKECNKSNVTLSEELEQLKKCLLCNFDSMKIDVEFFLKINLDDTIGYKNESIVSEIVDLNELQEFHELLEISIDQRWKLIYRGSRDGFSASDFHDKCDEKPRTLTIIKTESGDILGGYTDCTWDKSNKPKHGKNDYVFSFRNEQDHKIKKFIGLIPLLSENNGTIFCSSKNGPLFGCYEYCEDLNCDFAIVDCSNTNELSFSKKDESSFGHYIGVSDNDYQNFRVSEIEIFQSI